MGRTFMVLLLKDLPHLLSPVQLLFRLYRLLSTALVHLHRVRLVRLRSINLHVLYAGYHIFGVAGTVKYNSLALFGKCLRTTSFVGPVLAGHRGRGSKA